MRSRLVGPSQDSEPEREGVEDEDDGADDEDEDGDGTSGRQPSQGNIDNAAAITGAAGTVISHGGPSLVVKRSPCMGVVTLAGDVASAVDVAAASAAGDNLCRLSMNDTVIYNDGSEMSDSGGPAADADGVFFSLQ